MRACLDETSSAMTTQELTDLADLIVGHINRNDLAGLAETIAPCATAELVEICERLGDRHRAVMYRLLPKQRALEVFEALDPALQGDLVRGLRDAEVADLFAAMDPDDRVWLLDELPASLAPRLLRGLPQRGQRGTIRP